MPQEINHNASVWYFSYGIQMDDEIMNSCCSQAQASGIALVEGFSLSIAKEGCVVLNPSPKDRVWGRPWQLPGESALPSLKAPAGKGAWHQVHCCSDASTLTAYIHGIKEGAEEGMATTGYLFHLIHAAEHCMLPSNWIDRLIDLHP